MLLQINNKPLLINGDGHWIFILNNVVVTYKNNKLCTIKRTHVDASKNPIIYYIVSEQNKTKCKPVYYQLKAGDCVRNADKRTNFSMHMIIMHRGKYYAHDF